LLINATDCSCSTVYSENVDVPMKWKMGSPLYLHDVH
jgi:hypothetical protein